MEQRVVIYTDGACSKQGKGGWAWAIEDGAEMSGHAEETTNQRMEMQAVLEALKANRELPVTIVSDSAYVVNCFNDKWYVKWRANGWRTATNKAVANKDIWEPLVELGLATGALFVHVRGHNGDTMNEYVDKLAVAAKVWR